MASRLEASRRLLLAPRPAEEVAGVHVSSVARRRAEHHHQEVIIASTSAGNQADAGGRGRAGLSFGMSI